jgi:hypothetical protein
MKKTKKPKNPKKTTTKKKWAGVFFKNPGFFPTPG